VELLKETNRPAAVAPILELVKTTYNMGLMQTGTYALQSIDAKEALRALVELLDLDVSFKEIRDKPSVPFVYRKFVVEILQSKTGQKFGEDKAKWEAYLKTLSSEKDSQSKTEEPSPPAANEDKPDAKKLDAKAGQAAPARRGRVVDGDANPVAGAKVELTLHTGESPVLQIAKPLEAQTTDKDGYFSFTSPHGMESVGYSVTVPGYEWSAGQILERTKSPFVIHLRKTVAVRGTVTGPDGKPLANAPLTFATAYNGMADSAITDEQGRFEFKHVAPGRCLIYYPWAGPGRADIETKRWEKFNPAGKTEVPIPAPGVVGAALFELKEGDGDLNQVRIPLNESDCTVEGRLLDEQNKPVTGVKVCIAWRMDATNGNPFFGLGYPPSVTDAEGRFRLTNLPRGRWCLDAWDDKGNGYLTGLVDIQLVSGKTIHQDLQSTKPAGRP